MERVWIRRGVLSALTLALGLGASLALAKDLVLAEIHKPGHVIVQAEEFMAGKLAERSKNDLKVQLKHSGEVGGEDKEWSLIRAGSLDMARINLATVAADVPAAKLLSLPYLFRSRDHMWRVLSGDFGKRVAAEVEKAGGVVLAYYDSGTRSFYTSKKPIHSRSDFAGMKIRVQNSPVYKDLITELGATPVVVPYEKVVDAFKSGEIDAAENNTTSYVTADHYKYAKFYCLDEHSSVPEVLVMSKKTWDSLKPEQQQEVKSAATDSSDYMKKLWAEGEAQALAKAKKEGVTVVEKSQIAMAGIESFAVKLYSKYVTDLKDLDTVLTILKSK